MENLITIHYASRIRRRCCRCWSPWYSGISNISGETEGSILLHRIRYMNNSFEYSVCLRPLLVCKAYNVILSDVHGINNKRWLHFTYGSRSWSRDSAVGITTEYRLDGGGVGVRIPVETRFLSSPRRPDQTWGPSSLLSNRCWGFFPWG
jgi:hypothetical protein